MGKLPRIGSNITLSEQAYIVIKDAIINNKLKPNEILSEEALAEELGISRTPVRAALKKLAFERLIVINPGKNAMVADLSQDDLSNVFTIRIALEPVAARITASKASKEQIAQLEETLDLQDEAIKTEDFELYLQKDYDFHSLLAQFTGNEQLYDIIVNINNQVQRFLILSGSLQKNSLAAHLEHRSVLEAVKLGDMDDAETKMRLHVSNVISRW
jgi:DNA-binding GntR family transcriptional regulator